METLKTNFDPYCSRRARYASAASPGSSSGPEALRFSAGAFLKAFPAMYARLRGGDNLSQADTAISRLSSAMQMPMPGVLTILKMQLGI